MEPGKQFKPIYHGDQGVLLSHNEMRRTLVKPPDELRYQRGYTPERMAAVKATLEPSGDTWASTNRATAFDKGTESHPFLGSRGHHHIMEALARSTAPVESFRQSEGDTHVHIVDRAQYQGSMGRVPSGEYRNPRDYGGGHKVASIRMYATETEKAMTERIRQEHGLSEAEFPYTPPNKTQARRQERDQTENAEMTLLHELGHHASFLAGTGKYGSPAERGAEEARADDYMLQHHVRDPRTARRDKLDTRAWHSYEGAGGETAQAKDPYGTKPAHHAAFDAAYKAQRSVRIDRPPSAEEQVEQERETTYQQQSQALFRTGKEYGSFDTPDRHYMEPREVNFPPKEHARYPESQDMPDRKTDLNPNVNQKQHGG